jgi:drug/metabolite transporter (DMT)-like permease
VAVTGSDTPGSQPDNAPAPHPTHTSSAGFAAALGATFAWGFGNVFIAWVPLDGLTLAFHRLWLAAIIYTTVFYLRGGRLTFNSFRYGFWGALAFALDIATFFIALRNTTVANAITISALQPVVILFFAGAMFGERVRKRHVISTIVAIVGVALVVQGSAGSGESSPFGVFMAVLALFMWSWYFIASKKARQYLDTLEYLCVIWIVGVPVLGVLGLIFDQVPGDDLSPRAFLWVLVVVFLPGTGHLLINWAHRHATLLITSLLTLLMPVISTAGAAFFLDQPVGPIQIVGIGVVLAALAYVVIGDAKAAEIEVANAEEGPHS